MSALVDSYRLFAATLEQMDDDATDEDLQRLAHQAAVDLACNVDRTANTLRGLAGSGKVPGLIGQLKGRILELKSRIKQIERFTEYLEREAITVLDATESKKLFGSEYVLSIANNPPNLELDIKTRKRSFRHVLGLGTAESLFIPGMFLQMNEIWTLNTEKIREHLKSGEKLPWARLKFGRRLNIR